MKVLNALDLKAGKKADYSRLGSITQPIQFLSKHEKDEEWAAWNMDWLEWQGIKQVRRNAKRLLKNYKLAKGIIDKSDYIVEEDNDMRDLMETLTAEDAGALELKFYPIIPNVINILVSEFAKRNSKITFMGVDDKSYNEMLDQKRAMIEQSLLANAEAKMISNMMAQGMDPESPEFSQSLDPEKLKTLPEIQEFFSKSYTSLCEEWAGHQTRADEERFRMDELEERAFRDMLITDRCFWHMKMNEDDYDIELWNPVTTFYHKSPESRYISQGNWVGKYDIMTAADVIDKYGWVMTEEQMKAIESIYPIRAAAYPITGYQNDGTFYDPTRSHAWNTNMPSLGMRQYMSMYENWGYNSGDIITWIYSESEDYEDQGTAMMLRVTTAYWKTQVKVGHLTKVTETGEVITQIVDEDYKITDKPIYNTNFQKNKTAQNLVFGEHVEWIWINQTWGGVKIGPNRPSFMGMNNPSGINPIYLGIQQNKIGKLKFQFKGDQTLYGCKLPVEGAVFSDRNTKSTSLVDLMKPYQIGFNMTNNQIADIMVDELGTIIMFDQNTLPKHSLGEDWGKGNYAKAYVAMKNFQMLPLDTSVANTENPINFQHYQTLDLEQSKRLISRIQLSQYFKQQCFETVGITPERLGQKIAETETAKGIEQAVAGSYAQTEPYFIQFSDYLMPRVHQMRTDLAQYYNSTKPSVRLQYTSSSDEKVNFEINGTDLLLRDLNIYATTKANHRAIIEQLKRLATENNTSGASIYDLGSIIQAQSLAEIDNALKRTEKKTQDMQRQEYASQENLEKMRLEEEMKLKTLELDHETIENEKDRRRDILVAEIKSAGYGAMMDINQNMQSDYLDAMGEIKKSEEFQQTMELDQREQTLKDQQFREKANLEREKIRASEKNKNVELEIAKENKNRYDVVTKAKAKKQADKKK